MAERIVPVAWCAPITQEETVMWFLGAGVVLLLLKWLEVGPVAALSWWLVLAPFALAVVWWAWADSSGYTKRKASERMDRRKEERLERSRKALGRPGPRDRRR
jgi:small Trp-rich protein